MPRCKSQWAAIIFAASCAAAGLESVAPIRFEDVASKSGIDFVLHNSPTPEKHMIETMAGGIAVFDFDGDGRPDIFFTNGAALPSLEKTSPQYWNRLYHNEGDMKFRDVTKEAGVAGEGYSMGAAAADYDNDGRADLFVAGVNRNFLYHNLGNGRFEDVTAKAGIRSGEWAVAAGWFDYDNDGLLDLWVVHYANWSVGSSADRRFCGDAAREVRIYCHPKYFDGLASSLYRNRGDGTFEDVSEKAGIASFRGRGMSLAFADYDHDGFPDVFVTNDNMPNFLFHNTGKGTFEEVALVSGVALRGDGKPVASMGTDFRDYDNDGWPDISVVALAGETFPLFRNHGKGSFDDSTYASHLGTLSVHHSGWGTAFFDFNNDGWKDLFTTNSHVNDLVEQFEPAIYKEPNTVFANLGNGTFGDAPNSGLTEVKAHRGSAFADFDGDGKIDVIVSSLEGPPELWHNVSPEPNHWIDLKLTGARSNRDGIGARIRIGNQHNDMTSAVSYASSSLIPVHFGLGKVSVVDKIEIIWPSGKQQTLENVKADRVVQVHEPE
ncbi:MAG TPA: CRTAC1 family protein [Bryobacteraceae bacterium]|nr:CRTAC1 family protein [Bryobacteraceae bacterium]